MPQLVLECVPQISSYLGPDLAGATNGISERGETVKLIGFVYEGYRVTCICEVLGIFDIIVGGDPSHRWRKSQVAGQGDQKRRLLHHYPCEPIKYFALALYKIQL